MAVVALLYALSCRKRDHAQSEVSSVNNMVGICVRWRRKPIFALYFAISVCDIWLSEYVANSLYNSLK